MVTFPSNVLSAALDDTSLPVIDHLMEHFAPEAPYLTFGAPGVARSLAQYGRTVIADRPFSGEAIERIPEVELRIAGPYDPLVFPPGRFGFVHARWIAFDRAALANLTRWLKPGGVLLVEAPDDYPAAAMPKGPYRAVVRAVMERLNLPGALDLPGRLMQHGLVHVGCRHEPPAGEGFHPLLRHLISSGLPWPEVSAVDLRDWANDPVARSVPAAMNVVAWGMK